MTTISMKCKDCGNVLNTDINSSSILIPRCDCQDEFLYEYGYSDGVDAGYANGYVDGQDSED